MKMKYSKDDHSQLLKTSKELKQQGKNLDVASFQRLTEYNTMMNEYLAVKNGFSKNLILVIEKFLDQKLEISEFCEQIDLIRDGMNKCSSSMAKQLILNPEEQIEEFETSREGQLTSLFVTNLFCYCDSLYDINYEDENQKFRNEISGWCLSFQNAIKQG